MNKSNKLIIILLITTIILLVTMGIFNIFNKEKVSTNNQPINQFVTEAQFKELLETQKKMTPLTLEKLREYGVTEQSQLKLEFFFYTNSKEKAQNLAKELGSKGYQLEISYGDKSYLVTGWTNKMLMEEQQVMGWDEEMVWLGYKHDAVFDGWETNPDQ